MTHLRVVLVMLMAAILLGNGCASTPSWEEDRGIPFSPDDEAIAYQHKGGIYVARTQGDRHHRIYSAPEAQPVLGSPQWAPDRRALAFAVSGEEPDASGRLPYTIWYWPAPEELWNSARQQSRGDAATLPSHWRPAEPKRVVDAHARSSVQVRGGALFAWHPDGKSLLFLAAHGPERQEIMSVEAATGATSPAAPIRAESLAFSISPDGSHLLCAAEDPEAARSGLWLGPLGSGGSSWRRIEARPGPARVPSSDGLLDLRPRLGAWSADSQRLATIGLPADEGGHSLVVWTVSSADAAAEAPRRVALRGGVPRDLHWAKDSVRVGLLAGRDLVVADDRTGESVQLAGVQRVEAFVGWSAAGDRMAYLTPADVFPISQVVLPSGHRLTWAPADRHHLVIAQTDGTAPENRFSGMQVTEARWAHGKPKLSFWATYLPTITRLPPGDPAAVLDVEDDTVQWYPTDVHEYAQVGHYYLLNDRYDDAADFYGDALARVGGASGEEELAARLRLWRGIARMQQGERDGAADDLAAFREHLRSLAAEAAASTDGDGDAEQVEPEDPELAADRILLSTLLSMNQVPRAAREGAGLLETTEPTRAVQAHAFLALIEQATGDGDGFARRLCGAFLPGVLALEGADPERVEEVVGGNLEILTHEDSLRRLSAEAGGETAAALAALSASAREKHPDAARSLALAASTLARESRDVTSEIEALRVLASLGEPSEAD